MSNSNGIITAPINIAIDIPAVLGISSTDLGTQCQSSKINMWAKNKPMSVNKIGELTEADKKQVMYGISFPSVNPNNINIKKNSSWKYTPPTSNFRATDFEKYNHYSVPPFNWSIPNYINLNSSSLGYASLDIDSDLADIPLYNISIFDIMSEYYKSYYAGVIWYNASYDDYVISSDSRTIGTTVTGGREIHIPKYIINKWDDGSEVYAYGIISAIRFTGEISKGLSSGTAYYLCEKEKNGFDNIKLSYENEMENKIGINSLILLYNKLSTTDYLITSIEFVLTNSSSIQFIDCDISGYFDNESGDVFPIRTSSNHTIFIGSTTTIRIQQSINVKTSNGIIGISLSISSKLGKTQITSSNYNLNTNTWIS